MQDDGASEGGVDVAMCVGGAQGDSVEHGVQEQGHNGRREHQGVRDAAAGVADLFDEDREGEADQSQEQRDRPGRLDRLGQHVQQHQPPHRGQHERVDRAACCVRGVEQSEDDRPDAEHQDGEDDVHGLMLRRCSRGLRRSASRYQSARALSIMDSQLEPAGDAFPEFVGTYALGCLTFFLHFACDWSSEMRGRRRAALRRC